MMNPNLLINFNFYRISLTRKCFSFFSLQKFLGILFLSIFIPSLCSGQILQNNGANAAALSFPRLGVWWPDPTRQPLPDIARYDWVILSNDSESYVEPLRALNTDILILNSTNASELPYDPNADYNSKINSIVRTIPPQWFLTQVGATLAQAVDATTTQFYVTRVTAQNSKGTFDLFRPGDTALIDDESVYIQAVDAVQKKLTVRRGYIRPASSHSAGIRIASHTSHWPNTWLLNLSSYCPKAVVNTSYGPENWANYNSRKAAGLILSNTAWDGLLIDRNEYYQSWIIEGDKVRTIDPDQSNTLLASYVDFDNAWKLGTISFLKQLREAVGQEKILFTNWGVPQYDVLNGNNFEEFPSQNATAYGTPWRDVVMGNSLSGSYFDWMAKSVYPKLSMILTYEKEDGSEDYCTSDFTPDYRKMRFGLTTSLLNNGFFSYEMGSNGHGRLCLMWFDEYDNAGTGRGYLGSPLGLAYKAISDSNKSHLIYNRTFESGLSPWELGVYPGHQASFSIDKTNPATGIQSAKVSISQTYGDYWKVTISTHPIPIIKDKTYSLQFKARSDTNRTITVYVVKNTSEKEILIWYGNYPLTSSWGSFETELAALDSYSDSTIYFGLGAATGSVWFDDIAFIEGSDQIWRRDFQNGTVLVNASKETHSVPLGGLYRHIKGYQAPLVNTGAYTSQVNLPPLDGRILLGKPAMSAKDKKVFFIGPLLLPFS